MLTPLTTGKLHRRLQQPGNRHTPSKSDLDSSRLPSPQILQKDTKEIQNTPSTTGRDYHFSKNLIFIYQKPTL